MYRQGIEPCNVCDCGGKTTLYAREQDTPRIQNLRHEYRRWLDQVDIRNLVFVDEAGIHLACTRLYARAVDAERAVDSTPRAAGEKSSLIGGLSLEGLIAPITLPGSVDPTAFLAYVSEVLLPQLWQGAIVVLDNLRVDHAACIRAAIEAVGAKLVFLPPYSPDLSPIELCW